jgi:Cu+-exporting ATPase
MALEPVEASLEEKPDGELAAMTRRWWVAAALSAPLFVLAMAEMGAGSGGVGIQFLLATPVVVWGGAPFFARGWESVKRGSPNMFTLIALGVGAAYAYSVAVTFWPGMFPETFREHGGGPAVYFESAAVIVSLALLGQVLEGRARRRTGEAIKKLLNLAPKTARRVGADGREEDVPLAAVARGDLLRVRPGESVPTDGVVVEGGGGVDESMVTGEAFPVAKAPGDAVTGGTVNGTGSLVIRAAKVGAETLLARIVRMVALAQRSRAPIHGLADRVSAVFVPAVVGAAGISFVAWGWVGPEPRWAHALVAAVAVLIIACPCALGLATPMSIMVGVGRGALEGVLVRDAAALEVLEKVDVVVVDKTGTLTEGKPRVVTVVPVEGKTEEDVLSLAAALEKGSEHPLAGAILKAASGKGLVVEGFVSVTGMGVRGRVGGRQAALGNEALMKKMNRGVPKGAPLRFLRELRRGQERFEKNEIAESFEKDWGEGVKALRMRGETVVFVVEDGRPVGLIGVADPVKPSTVEALNLLRKMGVRVVLATGDNEATARAVAGELGIEDVRAGVSPEGKAEIVKGLKAEGHTVAMAGDGVNDAPALALADVGIAMGTGTDVAMESAGVTLVKGDLRGIARARALSRRVMGNIRQNLFFAFAYNALGAPVAAGALYPWLGWLLSPMVAAAAMSLSSVSVIGNALRLRRARL